MDKKIEIKEEDLLTDDIASQNEREFFQKVVSINTSTDAVLLDTDCDMTVKTEIKSETPYFKELVKQIKSETDIWGNNCKMDKSNEVEQNEGEFLLEDPEMIDKRYNSDHEIDNKIEIKEEPWWLETETSSIGNNTKDVVLSPIISSRLYPETVPVTTPENSPLCSAEVATKDASFFNGINRLEYDYKKFDVTYDVLTDTEYVHSDQYGHCNDGLDTNIQPYYLKHSSLNNMSKRVQQCSTCGKCFSSLSSLKNHSVIHGGKKKHQCSVCDKSFGQLSHLKRHNLIHEGKRPHQCEVCDKSFTQLSSLKRHTLVHEGKRAFKCTVCDKRFTELWSLKTHNLIHEGKRPHECKVCDKSFTQLAHLKTHHLIHEGKKPHKCKVCDKSFTELSTLKTHNFIHEGKRSHQCQVCDKSFRQLSNLKRHNIIHEGLKRHKCKVCDKSFNAVSNLKKHKSVHERKTSHQ